MISRGKIPDMKTKARYRLEGAYAVDWAVRAVDVMFALAGASGLYESGAVPRAFRDAHAVKQHFSFNTDIAGTTYGRMRSACRAITQRCRIPLRGRLSHKDQPRRRSPCESAKR